MPEQAIIERLKQYVRPYRVTDGRGFGLKAFDPADTGGLQIDKREAAELLQGGSEWLDRDAFRMNAESRSTLLNLERDSAFRRFRLKPSCSSHKRGAVR